MGNLISAAALRAGPKLFDFCALSSLFAFVYIAISRADSALSRALERLQTTRPHAKLTVVDRLIAAALIVAFCASVYYKLNITEARRGSSSTDFQLLWLLQPCYITQLVRHPTACPLCAHSIQLNSILCLPASE
jgi:hypothetical protein